MTALRRLPVVLTVSLAAAGLAACGAEHGEGERVVRAETEGIYLHLDHLKYQVQISRQLNPSDTADRAYLRGLPPGVAALAPDETWFGVFLRVQNDTDEPRPTTSAIHIVDTQENEYEPIELAPTNVFGYDPPAILGASELEPEQDSAAAETPIQGSMLLFKLKNEALDNRPLELIIEGAEVPQVTGIIDLDV